MSQEFDYTVSVWGGWTGTTISNYFVRAAGAGDAIRTARARFANQYGTNHINSAWIVRAYKTYQDRDLA